MEESKGSGENDILCIGEEKLLMMLGNDWEVKVGLSKSNEVESVRKPLAEVAQGKREREGENDNQLSQDCKHSKADTE